MMLNLTKKSAHSYIAGPRRGFIDVPINDDRINDDTDCWVLDSRKVPTWISCRHLPLTS